MTLPLNSTLFARQAIYDTSTVVCAYELLYRNGNEAAAQINNNNLIEGDAATSSVLVQFYSGLDMSTIIGNKKAFINFTYNHIIQQIPTLLPRDKIVIEVLETIIAEPEILHNLSEFKKQGYQIALDDFVF